MSLQGKVCVVTGANSGVGFAASRLLVERGAALVMVCRDPGRGERARAKLEHSAPGTDIRLAFADLASLDSVRHLAASLRRQLERVDVLVNNAGVYRARKETSVDGYEMTMAVNHLGHFLLTDLLLESLMAAGGRVINVSSNAHRSGDLDRMPLDALFRGDGRYSGWQAYSDSKLANVLFTFELGRRLGNGSTVTAHALHPGVLATRIWNQNADPVSLFMRACKPLIGRPRRGGEAVLRLAVDPALEGVSGKYFAKLKESRAAPAAYDEGLAARLWDLSTELAAGTSR